MNTAVLEQVFKNLARKYASRQTLSDSLWSEVVAHYVEKKRYYHNILHLENILQELDAVKDRIDDWETTVFSIAYHDIIYKATAKDNEEKSATLAKIRLQEISFPQTRINKCEQMILATKRHTISNDSDTNYFTDADLSILGKPWDLYRQYFTQVRQEYSIYPDLLYKPGRKKVLQHFLNMKQIFKTRHFYELYESKARINLRQEMEQD
jgi:predicted metal-dependent HD superfamily phosphohydrolase